jgi:lipopolysaccharide/colanic/teichoic acid biosynthesis glycosyltransferase
MNRLLKQYAISAFSKTLLFLVFTLYLAEILIYERPIVTDIGFMISIFVMIVVAYALVFLIKFNRYAIFTALLITTVVGVGYVVFVVVTGKKYLPLVYSYVLVVIFVILVLERLRAQKLDHLKIAIAQNANIAEISQLMGTARFDVIDTKTPPGAYDIIIADLEDMTPNVQQAYQEALHNNVELMHWTEFVERRKGRVTPSDYAGSKVDHSDLQNFYINAKRYADVLFAIFSAPFVLPLLAIGMAVVYFADGRPVFFTQTRIGRYGKPFRIYKLRTMKQAPAGGNLLTQPNDNRILPSMRLLRKTRIDEIPQIWNVLIGDMSLIGPRPEPETTSRHYAEVIPGYELRHLVRPGISGWAQVKQGYAGTLEEIQDKFGYDLYYIKYLSLDLDIRILVKTIITLVTGRGAR